ncbi:MAG TPA: S46 family peptidase [Verrucomicrobiae bacterium]|nr:S46 family peptidase [Verrucomicrobiae bacterium]
MNARWSGVALAIGVLASTLNADEGMWLFNDPPREYLKQKYGFEASPQWMEHVQKSSVRFNSGGSGSFVSPEGLVMSNHHVAADALQKFGDESHNYYRDGFYAKTHAEEKKCHDLELNVLMSIEDVTERVNAAVKSDMSTEAAFGARRAVMAAIEKESLEKTGLRSDVVTLYQGGKYHLYRFKKYTDVRLVFAPEQQIAFFGGDPDNFEYPRFDLDVAFFRVYENDKPLKTEHFLKWSKAGAGENELVFVSGHPGRTSRLETMADLEYKRDYQFPTLLARLNRMEVLLLSWSGRSEENARRAKELLFGVQNSRKARLGGLQGLMDPEIMKKKAEDEHSLRLAAGASDAKPDLAAAKGAWDKIAEAQKVIKQNALVFNLLEGAQGFMSDYFGIARTLVRANAERSKPNGDRLREFRDSNAESLELGLFSTEPLYDDFELLKLSDSLAYLAHQLGYENELVQKILAGKSPQARAEELVMGTKVKDVAMRKELYKSSVEKIAQSKDPMIQLALLIDDEARRVRKIVEEQGEVKNQAYAQIAKAKFAQQGTGAYPDATFTLRLAFGPVKGFEEGGKKIPFETKMAGLYERSAEHHNKPPFDIPPLWVKKKSKLDLDTPFNFVCTADIIGGNSGSPVINKNAEVVGLIFDGNIQSLVLDFVYSDKQARAVSVHSSAIVEALRKVYDAGKVADELTGKGKSK